MSFSKRREVRTIRGGSRGYDVNYDKFGMCRECRNVKQLRYSKEMCGWWCSDCVPKWTVKKRILK